MARELETPRLRLRAWTEEDVGAYAAMVADPEVMRLMDGPMTREQAAAQVAHFGAGTALPGVYHHAAERKDTGELVGRIGLLHTPAWPGPDKVEIGWLLGRAHWGRGYATEGARAALDHALGELGLPRVIAFTLPENGRSRAVMERLGMTLRGRETWAGRPHVWYAKDRPGAAIP